MERRLAAILAGDVAGYSRLVEADEEGTLARLRALRAAVIEPAMASHRGRVFKTTGDGFLAEFASVVDAARCAAALQQALATHEAEREPAQRIAWRLGLNLGDVVVEGGDVHGDGVNVAARLEALAEPGTVCVSATAHEHLRGKLELAFEDLGEQALKNIARPVRVYRLAARATAESPRPALPLPDKPSLVVLPFLNMSGDAEQEYFADGMTEEITTALSRIRHFFVIARNTAFTYKGKKLDLKQVGRELGVRYLLEGSVRKSGNRVRITGQLIEAESSTHLWADKFDGALEDVFDLQDRVTASVVGAIEPTITAAEIERASRKPPGSLQAYDLLLRAIGESWMRNREGMDRALSLSVQALALEPRNAAALAYRSAWLGVRSMNHWSSDQAADARDGESAARLAVDTDYNDPTVLAYSAWGLGLVGGHSATAVKWLDRAIDLNPNSTIALGLGAVVRCFASQYETAEQHATRAMRLSPYDPMTAGFMFACGASLLLRRQPDRAAEWLWKAANARTTFPAYHFFLSSALAHLGRLEDSRASLARTLALRPTTTISRMRAGRMYSSTADYEYVLEGARLAGLPE